MDKLGNFSEELSRLVILVERRIAEAQLDRYGLMLYDNCIKSKRLSGDKAISIIKKFLKTRLARLPWLSDSQRFALFNYWMSRTKQNLNQ